MSPSDNEVRWEMLSVILKIVVVAGLGIGLAMALAVARDYAFTSAWHKEAVDAGKAEYYLDEHHERQWRWKP